MCKPRSRRFCLLRVDNLFSRYNFNALSSPVIYHAVAAFGVNGLCCVQDELNGCCVAFQEAVNCIGVAYVEGYAVEDDAVWFDGVEYGFDVGVGEDVEALFAKDDFTAVFLYLSDEVALGVRVNPEGVLRLGFGYFFLSRGSSYAVGGKVSKKSGLSEISGSVIWWLSTEPNMGMPRCLAWSVSFLRFGKRFSDAVT